MSQNERDLWILALLAVAAGVVALVDWLMRRMQKRKEEKE